MVCVCNNRVPGRPDWPISSRHKWQCKNIDRVDVELKDLNSPHSRRYMSKPNRILTIQTGVNEPQNRINAINSSREIVGVVHLGNAFVRLTIRKHCVWVFVRMCNLNNDLWWNIRRNKIASNFFHIQYPWQSNVLLYYNGVTFTTIQTNDSKAPMLPRRNRNIVFFLSCFTFIYFIRALNFTSCERAHRYIYRHPSTRHRKRTPTSHMLRKIKRTKKM